MNEATPKKDKNLDEAKINIFVLSGGVGSSGEQIVRTVLAQFPDASMTIEVFPKVITKKQVHDILKRAVAEGAVVTHTFVDEKLRQAVSKSASKLELEAIDLVGPLMEKLSKRLKQEPIGKPGLYRQLYKTYFNRIDAMDYALNHDDGKNKVGWKDAEIILLGASRVGKTPISLYLSVLGWKVANIPIIAGIQPREEFYKLDPRRLIGLTITPSELVQHRNHRQKLLGVSGRNSNYTDPIKVYEELESIEKFLRRNGISIIDVTGKPIESSADEVIRIVRRKLKGDLQKL
jgi:regulator of PEP synthase PpsR (kinase-PPPase family)